MGAAMKRWLGVVLLVISGCRVEQPCGWDEELEEDASYEVTLLEAYTPESTMAFYTPSLGLTRPALSCGALDEVIVGDTFGIRMVQSPRQNIAQRCSFWVAEVTFPSIDLGSRLPLLINNQSYNQITVSGSRDFGGGCVGGWELSLHSPNSDPFAPQPVGGTPVVMAYRVFGAEPEANAACSALVGREPTDGYFTCGDAFVASMRPR